ncbi:hypothetical protein OHT61_17880 [Streptomyces sp. NBC_00178]|nr:hypothetical protein [Streptomyces sp. NBC_00178]
MQTHPLVMAITEQRIPVAALGGVAAFVVAVLVISGAVLVRRHRR